MDAISSTSTAFQADLLRVLEEGEFIPLVGIRTVRKEEPTVGHKERLVEDREIEIAYCVE